MSEPLPPALQRFLDWLPGAEPMGSVEPMLVQYREWLEGRGATQDEAGAAIGQVLRFMKERREGWPALFDRIYASPAPGYRTEPNALLVEAAGTRKPGRALDVCSGEGRNAVWLAGQGWQVTGFDVSAEGIAVARRHAAAAGVSVTLVQQASSDFDYTAQEWDLIAIFYAPVPLADPAYVDTLAGVMAPGGIVVVESFASGDSAARRRPVDLDPDELRAAFAGFDIERLDDVVDDPDWMDRPERLVRMIARKPVPITI